MNLELGRQQMTKKSTTAMKGQGIVEPSGNYVAAITADAAASLRRNVGDAQLAKLLGSTSKIDRLKGVSELIGVLDKHGYTDTAAYFKNTLHERLARVLLDKEEV
jgi:hypothetical protein